MCTCTDLVIFAPDCTYNRPIVATSHLRFPDSSGSLNDYVSGEEIYLSIPLRFAAKLYSVIQEWVERNL